MRAAQTLGLGQIVGNPIQRRDGGIAVRAQSCQDLAAGTVRDEQARTGCAGRGDAEDGVRIQSDAGGGFVLATDVAAAAAELFMAAGGVDGDGDAGFVAEAAEFDGIDRQAQVRTGGADGSKTCCTLRAASKSA